MSNAKKAQFSIKWDVRTGSPRKLWRALHDFPDDNGFEPEYEKLKPEKILLMAQLPSGTCSLVKETVRSEPHSGF